MSEPQKIENGPVRLTYRDGYTGKNVEARYATVNDALTIAFNYTAAEDAQVYDEDGAPVDMEARFRVFSENLRF